MNYFYRLSFSALLCAAFVLLLSVNPALAGIARMESMGMQEDTYWMIQKDEAYILFYNSAYLSKFSPQIYADPVNSTGGLIINPLNNLNVYITTGKPISTESFQQDTYAAATPMTKEQANFISSYGMGNMAFGVTASYSTVSSKNATTLNYSKSAKKAGAGFLMELGRGMGLDASANITSWEIENDRPGNEYKASTYDLDGLVRFSMAISEVSKLHIFGSYQQLDRSDKVAPASKLDDKYKIYTAGVSDEMNITKSTTVYAGIQGLYSKRDYDPSLIDKTTQIKVSAGVETSATENLIARFGFNRLWFNRDQDQTANTKTNTEQNANFAFGIGYRLGNLVFDWQINQSLIKDGPYFISGVLNSTSTQFEVRYNFETGSAKK